MLNVACIMGRLTADPELRYTQGGTAVARIALACNRPTRAGAEEQTDFIDVTAWGKTAEFVSRYFHKGQCLFPCRAASWPVPDRLWPWFSSYWPH